MNLDKVININEGNIIELKFLEMEQPNSYNPKIENYKPYFKLKILDYNIKNKYYTDLFYYDKIHNIFIISEWNIQNNSIKSLKKAICENSMKLVVFDLAKKEYGTVSVHRGEIIPKFTEKDKIIFSKQNGAVLKEFEVNIKEISWNSFKN